MQHRTLNCGTPAAAIQITIVNQHRLFVILAKETVSQLKKIVEFFSVMPDSRSLSRIAMRGHSVTYVLENTLDPGSGPG